MAITIKNLRPGVLILAEAGLRLGPGETAEIPSVSPQIQKSLDAGYLARLGGDDVSGADAAKEASVEATAATSNSETEAAGPAGMEAAGADDADARRAGGKRASLDALRRKAEEAAGGTG